MVERGTPALLLRALREIAHLAKGYQVASQMFGHQFRRKHP